MGNPNPDTSNLKPFTGADDPRRSNGRPKGSKNLATIVKELENENFDWKYVPIKAKEAAKEIGSPWRAIVYTAVASAMSGNVKAMEWLRKSGYGDKLDLTSGDEPLKTAATTEDIVAAVREIIAIGKDDQQDTSTSSPDAGK